MSKRVKNLMMEELRTRIGDSREVLVVDSSRLDAISTNQLRLALREKNISAMTISNSLARRALQDLGLSEGLSPYLQGPSTLVWGGEDVVALSKEIAKWAKELGPLEIKGGTLEGESLSADDVDALSKSPSREELLSQLVGMILSPGSRISGALLGVGGKLASQVEKIADADSDEASGEDG